MTHPTFKYLGTKIFDPSGLIRVGECDGGADTFRPVVLAQSAIPVILAPNGTVATNGTITLGTALPTIYASAWVYLPAGAVVGGFAGLYFATFSSTTVGVITTTYNSAGGSFTPYIATGTSAAVGSNSAYTQTTASDITLANITVPGGLMGANGVLRTKYLSSLANNVNTKTVKSTFSGTAFSIETQTANSSGSVAYEIRNRGVATSQTAFAAGLNAGSGSGFTSGGALMTAINTAADQPLAFTGQLAVATDYIVLEGFTVEVLPG